MTHRMRRLSSTGSICGQVTFMLTCALRELQPALFAAPTEYWMKVILLLARYVEIAQQLKPRIKAVVVVSAHWESVSELCVSVPQYLSLCDVVLGFHLHAMVASRRVCALAGWRSHRDVLGGPTGPAI
jgi:hypothetical protein